MKKFNYTETELDINKVLKLHDQKLKEIASLKDEQNKLDDQIASSENLLKELGYGEKLHLLKNGKSLQPKEKRVIQLPTWDEIVKEAHQSISGNVDLQSMFTEEELISNEQYLIHLREDFQAIHRLDAVDYSICITAGVLAAAVGILLVGIPEKTKDGLSAGPLSDYIRKKFDEKLPEDKIKELEKQFKVPYDASTNYNLNEYVDGLSSWFHRFHSLGHDPILGFIFGVFDILNGRFTAIDRNGKVISQVMGEAPEGMTIFQAIGQVFGHMKSDVNTAMGLPAPMMTLFNLFQFGSIGEEKLTIAEVGRGMYAEGYDFQHFCSMSVPTMIIEAVVRISYTVKRVKEGHPLKESLPIGGNRWKKPKLQTMLFIAHTITAAVNGGKVYFTQNPLAINYAEWLAFIKYSLSQLKWTLCEKPKPRDRYVDAKLNEEWFNLHTLINDTWENWGRENFIVLR